MARTLNILKYPWHIAHDYELFKIGHTFKLYLGTHRQWAYHYRPLPAHIQPVYDLEDSGCELMILHVDQWTWHEVDKRRLFEKMKRGFSGKKIIINHGCNVVDGCTNDQMMELVEDYPVVCNSSLAYEKWAIPNSRYIHHGMSPEEWPESNYGNNNIVVTQPPGNMHAAFRNNEAAIKFEEMSGIKIDWVGRDRKFSSFAQYRSFLANSSVIFSPSYASPNPRARSEAMLCGLVLVSTNMHGESEYIENEKNGYVSNNMKELYEYLLHLHNSPEDVRRMGRASRQTAQENFNIKRFSDEWDEVLNATMSDKPIG